MPFQNSRGDVICGGGGELGSYNGQYYPFETWGSGVFVTDDDILVILRSNNSIARWSPKNWSTPPVVVQPPRNANAMVAGAGRWLAFVNTPSWSGVFGSLGDLPGAGIGAASREGTLAYVPNYQVGTGIVLVSPDGTKTKSVPGMVPYGLQVQPRAAAVFDPDGLAAIWDGPGAYGCSLPRPKVADARAIKRQRVGDVDWLVYWSQSKGFIAQIDGDPYVWLIDSREIEYNHDVCEVNGKLRIVWSTTTGERPQDLVIVDVTRDKVEYLRTASGVPPMEPQWTDFYVPPTPLPPVVLPDRPLWIGCFEFQQTPQGPGNIALAVRNISGHQSRVQIVAFETRDVVSGDIAGEYIGGSTVDDIERLAATLTRRPVAYWDDNVWPRWPVLPDDSWLCIRAYQPVGQSLEAFEQSVAQQIAAAPNYPIAIVGQAYTQLEPPPSILTKDLAPLQRVLLRLASTHANVVALLLFSGYGRAGGLQDHPDDLAFWTEIVPQIARPPLESLTWPVVEPPQPPDVDPPQPEKPKMIPPIGDDEIIELASIYDKTEPAKRKDDEAYYRDGEYYALGYARNRTELEHAPARDRYAGAASGDEYYVPTPPGMFFDNDTIEVSARFISRYKDIGRFQRQSREENNRDQTYYAIVYAREREKGRSHENAMREMERAMCKEAGVDDPYPPQFGGKRNGVPRADGRCIVDDDGEFNPLLLTFMWSLQGALNEPERYRENLAWAASKLFDGKRPLYEVNWNDPLKIDPATFPDHLGACGRDMDVAYDEYGLRDGITLSGKGTGYDLVRLAGDVGGVIAAGRAHKVLVVEMQNEYTNGGDPLAKLQEMARKIRPLIPNLIALSYLEGGSTPEEADKYRAQMHDATRSVGGNVIIRHTERNPGDYGWRDVRQAYDFHLDGPFIGADWEGPGPGSSGSTNSNPLQLAMKRFIAIMCGSPIFVLHTGTGVYGDGKPSSSGVPRPPNFWEIPGIDAICSALRGIDALVPAGLCNWTVANTQWVPPNPVAPFQPESHWEGEDGFGVNKAYSALAPDGRFVQAPCGVRGEVVDGARRKVRFVASYPVRDVTVYDPIALTPIPGYENLSFAQGQTLELAGGGQDAMVAYIIHGRR